MEPQYLLNHRYKVLQILSDAGGFGQTFLAEDTQMPSHRRCVIKKLRPVADPEEFKFYQDRFQREAAILERLGDASDQIPKLYAYFVENNEFYLVQEMIDGLTLRQKVRRDGVLNERAVMEILGSLLNVLMYVHSENIIHRDIKPDNIILRERDNRPVLIDFGIVKEVLRISPDGSPTSSMLLGGTPGYTSLEQAAGRPVFASDLFSLGATAIYLLTGENPQKMIDNTTGEINWRRFAPNVSTGFASVLNKATESHSRDRYQTAVQMREDLYRLFHGQNPFAPLPSPVIENPTVVRQTIQPLNKKPPKSNALFYLGGGLVLGFLFIGSLVGLVAYINYNNSKKAQNNFPANSNANRSKTENQNANSNNANTVNLNKPVNANTPNNANSAVNSANAPNANAAVNSNVNTSPAAMLTNGTFRAGTDTFKVSSVNSKGFDFDLAQSARGGNCIATMDGRAAWVNPSLAVFSITPDEDAYNDPDSDFYKKKCKLSFKFSGTNQVNITRDDFKGCSYFHGANCDFGGNFKR